MLKAIKNSQSGSLLLMSILILTGLLSAAGTIGLITLKNLQQANLTDSGLMAIYAAESGVEDALYELRKLGTPAGSIGGGSLDNLATYTRTVTTLHESINRLSLDKGDSWHIDLISPNGTLAALDNPIKSLLITWQSSGAAWLEVQVTPWDTSGNLGTPITNILDPASSGIVNLLAGDTILYRVRVKPLYENITNVVVKAYSSFDAGNQVDLPGQNIILSTGSFGRAKQSLRATMPQRAPLSGAFDYVLFTESDLVK